MSLPIELLRVVHAIASKGSITLAAEMLEVSQPAVSKQLRQLEKRAGVQLVERRGRGVALTREGELVADYAGRMFALLAEAESALGDLQGLRRGHLAIGAGTTVGVYALPEAIVRFRQRFPGVELRTEVGASHLLRQRLREGAIEVAITEALPSSRDFVSDVFASDELVGIVGMDHRLARRRTVSAAVFSREPFVAREAVSGTQSLVERVFRERRLRVTPIIRLSSTEAVKRAVSAGLGVSIVSKMSLGFEIEAKKLAVLKLTDVPLRRPIYVVRLRGRRESRAVTAFLCLLKHVIRGTLPRLKESS